MTLADPRVQAFLATKEVVLLALVGTDGRPLAMPMWFLYEPRVLTMISEEKTRKVQALRRDPRVCVVAEAGTRDDVRGVTVHGRAEFLPDGEERRALVDRFHARYHPDLAELWGGRAMPPDRVMLRIVPERVGTWGLE